MEYAPGSSDKENPTLIMPAFSNQYKYCLLDSSSALSPQHLTPQSTTLQVRGPTEQILQTSSNPSTPIPVSFTVSHEQQERSATTKAMPPVEKPLQSDGLHWEASMAGRTHWTKAMLQRLLDLGQQQTPPRETLSILQVEFGNQKAPKHLGEVVAEYNLARRGPIARQWTPAMEKRIQEYSAQGMDVNDITTELFHEFAKPESGYWQETYRKVQEMKLEGKLA